MTALRTAPGRAAGALLRLLVDVLLRGVLDAAGTAARRVRRIPPRDPRQARFVTVASLQWVRQHRAWSWFYLVRYLRFARLRLRSPHIVTEGFVFLGRDVELLARRGYGRLVLGRWVHIGSGNALRSHEGTLRIGDKCVFGKDNTVNGYLDIEFGAATIVADWVYVCDFDHVFTEIHWPIKDQGITKSPVRIGPDVWLGTKVTILRGVTVGQGCVVAAHALVNTDVPPYSVAVGVPVRVVRDRIADYADAAATRAALADIARKHEAAAAAESARRPVPDDAVPEIEAEGAPVTPHGPADPRLHGAGRS